MEHFVWETILACPVTDEETPCVTVSPSGDLYDLTQLQLAAVDWHYTDPDNPAHVYYLSVCRPLLSHYGSCDKVCGG